MEILFKEFCNTQEDIYNKFRRLQKEAIKSGMEVDFLVSAKKGGFFLVYDLDLEIKKKCLVLLLYPTSES